MKIKHRNDGGFRYFFILNGLGFCPTIVDYENEDWRANVSNEVILMKENIRMEIGSSRMALGYYFECYNKGGFSPLDLWRCMYEESVEHIGKELLHLRIIEVVEYNANDGLISVHIAT